MPKQPDPMTMDLYGADRYEVAPKWGPGMVSGPYSTNAAYFTAAADQPVMAMGCSWRSTSWPGTTAPGRA